MASVVCAEGLVTLKIDRHAHSNLSEVPCVNAGKFLLILVFSVCLELSLFSVLC